MAMNYFFGKKDLRIYMLRNLFNLVIL